MIRNIFFAGLVVVSVSTTYPALIKLGNNDDNPAIFDQLRYRRTARNIVPTAATVRRNLYYFSQNSAAYESAEGDCKSQLGADASLVSIETQDELNYIKQLFKRTGDAGSLFWTSGRYNMENKAFEWENGIPLSSTVPWGELEPSSELPATRIAINMKSDLKYATSFNTDTKRYLCEKLSGTEEEVAVPCYSDNDLVVVVDSSKSIGQDEYVTALDFVTHLVTAWADNPGNRVAVIVYSSNAEIVLELTEDLTVEEIRKRVQTATYLDSGTMSDLGINLAVAELQNNNRSVPQNVVFLTDGTSESPSATILAAQNAREAEIRGFAVGIGSDIKQEELNAIAGNNSTRVFKADQVKNLLKLLQRVSQRVCKI
ncbi:unnamed protein product [Orchesella dallaii]|uniref:Uncharacterized protein n=1 Tax=Orchesella dallaii TaxID=48710 RepID=A0ABP1PKW6_9HEXA